MYKFHSKNFLTNLMFNFWMTRSHPGILIPLSKVSYKYRDNNFWIMKYCKSIDFISLSKVNFYMVSHITKITDRRIILMIRQHFDLVIPVVLQLVFNPRNRWRELVLYQYKWNHTEVMKCNVEANNFLYIAPQNRLISLCQTNLELM